MNDLTPEMLDYYERRCCEYESIYSKPERQADLVELENWLLDEVRDQRVLELACGTGYWTRRMVKSARSLHATDGSQKLADMAKDLCTTGEVSAGVCDAYNIPVNPQINCIVAGFFYSHVPIRRQQPFLQNIRRSTVDNARLILFDNLYVEGSSTVISRTDTDGNSFQTRHLKSGEQEEVIKNFPTRDQLIRSLESVCNDIKVVNLQYFWMISANLKP